MQEPSSLNWLTPELRSKVRNIFEIKYNSPLSDNDVELIANNLVSFFELILKNRGTHYAGE